LENVGNYSPLKKLGSCIIVNESNMMIHHKGGVAVDINTQQNIAGNLKLLRNAFGYTQAEVAEELHICRSTYTLYELGKKLPSTDMLVDLAALYDIRLDVLLDAKTNIYIQKALSQEGSRKDIARLVDTYFRLPPHAQGKLMERADVLLEKEGFLAIG